MQNHRITNKPATTTEDFQVINIMNDDKYNLNKHRIKECDLFLPKSVHTNSRIMSIEDRFENVGKNYVWGIICHNPKAIDTLKQIDWNKAATPGSYAFVRKGKVGRVLDLQKSDIIAAYNDFLRNEKWHIDYINHYEKHKCKTTE